MNLDDVKAQLTLKEKEVLFSIPELTKGGNYCNIGDGIWGGSAILLALGLKTRGLEGHIWTVDTYRKRRPQKIAKWSTLHGVESYITRCEGPSSEWAVKLEDEQFEFTFIDGGHTYEVVLGDAKSAMKNSKLIAFHDTDYSDIDKAIEDSGILEWEQIEHVDKIRMFRKGD